jgi:Family of unknown function (DUF6572)
MPGLESPDEIDLIAEDEDGRALLSIVQTGPWPTGRFVRDGLELKVSNYLRFALEGQMIAKYPMLRDRPVVVELTYDEPPPKAILSVWSRAAKTAMRRGVRLSTRKLGDESFWSS